MNARIAIVGGGGGVGSSLAFNLLLRDEPYEIALVDGRSGNGALARDGPPAGARRRRDRRDPDRRARRSRGGRQQVAAERFVRNWYMRHVALDSGRSSTWTSGHGLARMVAAVTGPGEALWPASVVLEGEYGVHGAALSVPVTLARDGVRELHEWPLSAIQRAPMRAAGEAVLVATVSL